MKYLQWFSFTFLLQTVLVLFPFNFLQATTIDDFKLSLQNVNDTVSIKVVLFEGKDSSKLSDNQDIIYNGKLINATFFNGIATVPLETERSALQFISLDQKQRISKLFYYDSEESELKGFPLWLSILPPLLAILFALIFREVIFSLLAGIWVGSFLIMGAHFKSIIESLFLVVEKYIVDAVNDVSHASIIIFSILIGGMVAIISRNGGMAGFLQILSRYARSVRSTQLITWLSGLLIFFDDYANTLIIGNTLRPLTDKFRISREKLAYLVDSTAAPIASIAFVSTWIGYEVGEIESVIQSTEALSGEVSAYQVFLNSLKYAYYPIFTLLMMFMLIWYNRDFSFMYKAEKRARESGITFFSLSDGGSMGDELKIKEGIGENALLAIIPILTLIITVFIMIVAYPGSSASWNDPSLSFFRKLQTVIGNADPYKSLLWGSSAGVLVAVFLSLITKKLNLRESADAMLSGFKTMLSPAIILILAWSLAAITQDLYTAEFMISLISPDFNPRLLPAILFIVAALISFATGSSWGTMAILFPIGLPLAFAQGSEFYGETNMQEIMPVFFNATSVILAGSVFGDHCSPISDTTILSSLSSQCDHIEHVRTQLPYAVTVGLISILCGGLLFALSVPWWIAYLAGFAILYFVVKGFGKRI